MIHHSTTAFSSAIQRFQIIYEKQLLTGWCSVRPCKPFSIQSFIVFVGSDCAVEYFVFSEREEIFLIQFCVKLSL